MKCGLTVSQLLDASPVEQEPGWLAKVFKDVRESLKEQKHLHPSVELADVIKQRDRLHRILVAVSKGIHTDKVDAQITMGLDDQQLPLIEVLEREMNRSKPQ